MYEKIADVFDKLTNYSPVFYVLMIFVLVGVTVDFFNNEYLNEYVIEILITLNIIPLTSFAIMKATGRKIKPEPSLVCPKCYGKMKTDGDWKCLDCEGEFKHGKKENK